MIDTLFFISCTSITIVDADSCLNVASVMLGGLSGAMWTEISRLAAEDCYILDRQLQLWAQHRGWCTGQVGSEAFENPADTVDWFHSPVHESTQGDSVRQTIPSKPNLSLN